MNATPPPLNMQVTALSNDHTQPRYRFSWRTAGGRRRQMTIALVNASTVEQLGQIIAADAARDTAKPTPHKSKPTPAKP